MRDPFAERLRDDTEAQQHDRFGVNRPYCFDGGRDSIEISLFRHDVIHCELLPNPIREEQIRCAANHLLNLVLGEEPRYRLLEVAPPATVT